MTDVGERFFAPCPRGLEGVLSGELARLGAHAVEPADGGAAFRGPLQLACRVNLESRIASRVLWQVAADGYRDAHDLYALALACDWGAHFGVDRTLRVNLSATQSPLTSLEFAALRIKDAVCDRFRTQTGRRPSVDKAAAEVRIHAYLTADRCTLYLDTSGEALFKRGYRRATAEAPLRENLAAGLLALAGWDPVTPLLDPMCGSGTIVIEAAALALDLAPGLGRAFGFEHLAGFDRAAWRRLQEAAAARRHDDATAEIFGSDRDVRAVELARSNARAAGVGRAVRFRVADVLELVPPVASGTIVANPPYGVRLDDSERLATFYPKLGDVLKQRFSGWSAYLLTADRTLADRIGLKPSRRIPLFNGALECRLYGFRLVSGRLRPGRSVGAPTPGATGGSAV